MNTRGMKTMMGSLLFAGTLVSLVVAGMAPGPVGSAPADDAVTAQCNAHMLRSLYLWTLEGYQNFGGNPVPKALIQGIQFNGNGTLTIPFGTVNIGGFAVFDVSGSVGTYTVGANCTGTISIADGPTFNMYVGPGAQELSIINTGGGPGDGTGGGLGTAKRLP